MQFASDLDHFHACQLPCSRVNFRDDPFSGRRGDSGVPYSFIYRDYYIYGSVAGLCQVGAGRQQRRGETSGRPVRDVTVTWYNEAGARVREHGVGWLPRDQRR